MDKNWQRNSRKYCLAHISVISGLFWLFLGSKTHRVAGKGPCGKVTSWKKKPRVTHDNHHPSIRRNFHYSIIMATTYLTPSHPVWIDILSVKNFSSKFIHCPSWGTNSMYCLIQWLSQQNAVQLQNKGGTNIFLTLDYGITLSSV